MLITLKSDIRPPTAPVLGTPTAVSSTALSVPMTTAATDVGGVASYSLERATSAGGTYSVVSAAATFPYSDSGLVASTTYYYRCRATDAAGNVGAYSAIVSGTTSAAASGFDYYIGPSGSDANPGTEAQPWAYTALYTKASTFAGKRVGALDGTYVLTSASGAGTNTGDSGWAQAIRSTAAGTAGAHTVIQAVNTRQAIFTGYNGSAYFQTSGIGAPTLIECQAQYVDIVGIVVTGTAGHGITIAASNVTVEDCHIYDLDNNRHVGQADTNMGGIYFRGSVPAKTGILIRNCKIHDIAGKTGDANAIGDLFGVNGVTIEYCTIYNCPTASYWKVNAFNVVMRYNHIYDCTLTYEGWAMGQTGGAGTNEIYGCIVHGNSMGGPTSASSNGAAAIMARVYNNTIIFRSINGNPASSYGYIVMQGSGSTGAVQFYNNAVLLDAALPLGNMIRFPASTVPSATRVTKWNYNRYSRFTVDDGTSTNHDASNIATWQGFGYDANSPVVGSLGLVDENDPDTVASMAPAGGSALLLAGEGGINIGHTGLGVTPGCDF